MPPVTLPTAHGEARLSAHLPAGAPRGLALLLHGAGTGTDVPVLLGLADALAAAGVLAVRLDQPYRVAGRRAPAPARQLDAVVATAVPALRDGYAGLPPAAGPLLLAGRSSGARVACRTAASLGAAGVVALGFPLVPPGRPGTTRADELAAAGVPVLVVQGERDAFGGPAAVAALGLPGVAVHAVAGGDHVLRTRRADGRSEADAVAEAVRVAAAWLVALRDEVDPSEGGAAGQPAT